MATSADLFRTEVKKIADDLGLDFQISSARPGRSSVNFTPRFPLWINLDIDEEEHTATIYATARAYGVVGDKSDYHDFLSGILASHLRISETSSTRVIKLEMADMLPDEIYAASVIFDRQPAASYINLQQPDFALIERILKESTFAAFIIGRIWSILGGGEQEEEWLAGHEISWVSSLTSSSLFKNATVSSYARQNPNWEYCRIIDEDIFILKLGVSLLSLPHFHKFKNDAVVLEGVNSNIITSGQIKNFISHDTLSKAQNILGLLNKGLDSVVLVPTESHLYLITNEELIGIFSDGGYEQYVFERERIIKRHQSEAKYLLPTVKFEWRDHIDDEEFEKLIVELVNREPGVVRARKIGMGNEPDAGRDILVDWYRPLDKLQPNEERPFVLHKVVVQCKAYNRPVGKSKVSDLVDLLHFHDAKGYLLAALSGVTRPLIDFLEKLNSRDHYWTDWWTRIEIEERLRANRDIALRYTHLKDFRSMLNTLTQQ